MPRGGGFAVSVEDGVSGGIVEAVGVEEGAIHVEEAGADLGEARIEFVNVLFTGNKL